LFGQSNQRVIVTEPLLSGACHRRSQDAIGKAPIELDIGIGPGEDLQGVTQVLKLSKLSGNFRVRLQELINPDALISRQGIIQIPAQQLIQ
jgi:hypothetical protein